MNRPSIPRQLILAACCLAISLFCFTQYGRFIGFNLLETSTRTQMIVNGRYANLDTNRFVYIGIDKPTYADRFWQLDDKPFEQWTLDDHIMANVAEFRMGAWSRAVWAEFAERVMSAGARCLIIDVMFEHDEERLKGDAKLGEVVTNYAPRVIIGSALQTDPERTWVKGPPKSIVAHDEFGDNTQNESVGLVAIFPEHDGTYQRGVYRFSNFDIYKMMWEGKPEADTMGDLGKDVVYETLSARAVQVAGYESNLPPVSVRPLIRFAGPPDIPFPKITIADIIDPDVYRTAFLDKGRLKDKIVLVGAHHNVFQDFHDTPFGVMRGPEYHLNLINAAIENEFIAETTFEEDQMIVLVAAVFTMLMTMVFATNRYVLRFFIGAVLSLAYLYAVWDAFNSRNLLIGAIAVPVFLVNSTNVVTLALQSIWTYADKRAFEATMGKYFSPAVMEEVMNNPGSLDAKSATVTLLLTDLRNSTPLAEKLGPGGMFKLLNQIFEAQTDAIMNQDGQLEHFLGDQFLSYWGAPYDQPDGPNQSLRAARELIVGMEKVKEIQEPEVKAIFGYGVALHCGFALVGNKGSEKKMEYGLVGDTINEAARIEALTKYYGAQLLVSQEIFTQLTQPGRHRLIDRVIVKGKSEPVVLYELEQIKSPENFDEIIAAFNSAFTDYSDGKFPEAKEKFQKLIDEHNDGPSKAMLSRCEHLIANPDPDWKGVWKMESK